MMLQSCREISIARTRQVAIMMDPYKGQGEEAVAAVAAKQLVDDDVVGPDPGDPAEPRQALEEIAGEPVPQEGAGEDHHEPLVAADAPAVGARGVGGRMVVEGVKEGAVDEVGRPDHGGRPDEESPGQSGQPVARAERRDAKHDLPQPPKVLLVPHALGNHNVGGIQGAAAIRSLEEDGQPTGTQSGPGQSVDLH